MTLAAVSNTTTLPSSSLLASNGLKKKTEKMEINYKSNVRWHVDGCPRKPQHTGSAAMFFHL